MAISVEYKQYEKKGTFYLIMHKFITAGIIR